MEQLLARAEPSLLIPSPAGQVFDRGANRYSFGVFTRGREQVTDARVALYFAHGPTGKARGPFPARVESLVTSPAFRAKTTALDPDAAQVVYVIPRVVFDAPGEWRVIALFRDEDGLRGARLPSAVVGKFPKVPDVGQKAPLIHTPTAAEVGGDLSKIDTRVPPDDMHEIDYADVYGKQPIVLLFATPQLCESRTCGPVVDIEAQAKEEIGDDDIAFIHMEVYRGNDPNKGIRPQLHAFNLPSEPWLFVIDRRGKIRTRIEGAFSAEELGKAVRTVG